jgi:hypothetical protein
MDLDIDMARVRMAGAIVAMLAVVGGMTAMAALFQGPLGGGLFAVLFVVGFVTPPVVILVLRDGLWPKGPLATGLAVAAQIAFGNAALIRRDDGRYEWTLLREADEGYVAELDDGTAVPIAADAGELYSFGFGKLAVVEQKTDRNLRQWAVAEGDAAETRAGIDVAAPTRERGGVLVSLARIQRAVRGSASSTLVRRGRDKALNDEGGTGQLSELWTMAFATILLLVGFGMTAGVLLL